MYCSDKGEIHMNKKVYCKRTKAFYRIFAAAACSLLLAGCQAQKHVLLCCQTGEYPADIRYMAACAEPPQTGDASHQIGRASCRERV